MSKQILEQIKVRFSKIRVIKSEHGQAQQYKGTIEFNNKKESFQYTDSIANFYDNKRPEAKSLIYCVLMDATCDLSSFEDFCSEFGYDSDSIKHKNIYDACIKSAEKLGNLFNSTELSELNEAMQDY